MDGHTGRWMENVSLSTLQLRRQSNGIYAAAFVGMPCMYAKASIEYGMLSQ